VQSVANATEKQKTFHIANNGILPHPCSMNNCSKSSIIAVLHYSQLLLASSYCKKILASTKARKAKGMPSRQLCNKQSAHGPDIFQYMGYI
jgi:hypothetical protein